MLVTLYGRALENQAKDPIRRGPAAEQAVRRLDYDFANLKMRGNDRWAIAARANVLDNWATEFLANKPQAFENTEDQRGDQGNRGEDPLEQWSPGIKLVTKWSVMDQDFPSIQRMSIRRRWLVRLLFHVRALREMGLRLRYEFQ